MTRPQPEGQQDWRERQEVERAYREDGAEVQWSYNGGAGLGWREWEDEIPPSFSALIWWRVKPPKPVEPREWRVVCDSNEHIYSIPDHHTDTKITVVELLPGWRLVGPEGPLGGES